MTYYDLSGQLEGRFCRELGDNQSRIGHLYIRIGAFEEMGHTNSTQQISTTEGYKISIAARSCRPGRGDSFGAKVAGRISHSDRRFNDDVDDDDNELILDYENVDHTIMIELLFYDSDEDKGDNAPIGALWLPVVDIINYNARLSNEDTGSSDLHNNSSTRIDSWFAVTPIGKVQLRINFSKEL